MGLCLHTSTPCNTLQHPAAHLQHTCGTASRVKIDLRWGSVNTLQHPATPCNTLQHTATHCNTLQHTVCHCNTATYSVSLQHCNTLQHTECGNCNTPAATHCNIQCVTATLQHKECGNCNTPAAQHRVSKENTLGLCQYTATHCNTPQHTATHLWHGIACQKRPTLGLPLRRRAEKCSVRT